MSACFEKNAEQFIKLYEIFKNPHNSQRALIWCVRAGWKEMIYFLIFREKVSLHACKDILADAVVFNESRIVKYILKIGEYENPRHFPEIIDAVRIAEDNCKHEVAVLLMTFLLFFSTEGVLVEKYRFKMSDNLRAYMRQKEYFLHTYSHRKTQHLQPVDVES